MPRSRMILVSPLIALLAGGSALVFAQDPGQGQSRTVQPAPRAARTAQPAQGQAPVANDPAQMKRLLRAWERQSEKLKALDVHIYRIDKDFKWGDENHFDGRAVFKAPNLAYLDFSKLNMKPDAKGKLVPVINPKNGKWDKRRVETIVCSQNEVWQYLHENKQILIFPLAKGERQRALEEGPLPFLFNMKAAEAEARYEMSLVKQDAQYYVVKVIPKLKEDQESFKTAFLYLEKTFLLPTRIALLNADGKSSRDYLLRDIKSNEPVDDKIFKGGRLKGWMVQNNPAAQAPQQGNAAGRTGVAGGIFRR
jgi:TIGR03009 family protein